MPRVLTTISYDDQHWNRPSNWVEPEDGADEENGNGRFLIEAEEHGNQTVTESQTPSLDTRELSHAVTESPDSTTLPRDRPLPRPPRAGFTPGTAAPQSLTCWMKTKDGWVTGTVAWHVPESRFDHYPKDKATFCHPNTTITCMVKGCEATRDLSTEPEFVPGLDYQVRCQRGASHPDLRYYTCDERGEFKKFAFKSTSASAWTGEGSSGEDLQVACSEDECMICA